MTLMTSNPPCVIHRLTGVDATDYRHLRLEGLRDAPEAFGSTLEDETSRSLDWFADRLGRNAVFGASLSLSSPLAGVVGLRMQDGVKERHKGLLWGMFVQPEARRARVGKALVAKLIEFGCGLSLHQRWLRAVWDGTTRLEGG